MGGGGVSAFFLVFFWGISKGKGGGRWREDKLKSAKRIKSFCHDNRVSEKSIPFWGEKNQSLKEWEKERKGERRWRGF